MAPPLSNAERQARWRERNLIKLTDSATDIVERLIEAAKSNRHGHRDSTMILVAFTHGLRASELVNLKWDQVDFAAGRLHVNRVKRGTPATHPLRAVELRALRRLKRESLASP